MAIRVCYFCLLLLLDKRSNFVHFSCILTFIIYYYLTKLELREQMNNSCKIRFRNMSCDKKVLWIWICACVPVWIGMKFMHGGSIRHEFSGIENGLTHHLHYPHYKTHCFSNYQSQCRSDHHHIRLNFQLLLYVQGPFSQKSRNFSSLLRVPQLPLHVCNADVLSHHTSQSSWFFLHH